ncbi:hypothetical protein B0T18DRAFT_74635 [Schizothecium vesticola]|uniref:Uncharacterized protein n=1 Tax=Schizothecium vesticola TaxID=314040 RepID=A0AA40F647_9PEZI|nr:hypothetical protein B0T18DRAFT_74635 [Schizothecium vesticola]
MVHRERSFRWWRALHGAIAGWTTTTKRRGERRQEMENVSPSIENLSLGWAASRFRGRMQLLLIPGRRLRGFVWEGNPDIYVLGDPDLRMDGCELPESCPTRQHPILPFLDLDLESPVPTHQLSRVITCILVPNFAEEGSVPGSGHHQAETQNPQAEPVACCISLVPAPLSPADPVCTTNPRQAQLAARDSSRPFLAAISSDEKRRLTIISTEQARPGAHRTLRHRRCG